VYVAIMSESYVVAVIAAPLTVVRVVPTYKQA